MDLLRVWRSLPIPTTIAFGRLLHVTPIHPPLFWSHRMESTAVNPPARRGVRRRWRVPPAILHGQDEPLESAGILDEVPGPSGLVLWQSLRDVTLWASTPPFDRDGLFSESAERRRLAAILSAGFDPQLEQPLGMITAMVGRPGRVSAERLALACRRVAQWAEAGGSLATALAFAQAAALACPGDASAAFKVGQIARRRAEHARAETWFRRAIALARQEGDWASYSLGFAGLGTLYMQRGNFPKARSFHSRRLRAARRHGLRDLAGGAYHDLCTIAFESGNFDEAQLLARQAFDTYGPRSPSVPRLAHDVAYLWTLQGYFGRAVPVLKAVLPYVTKKGERLVVLSNIARAAGASANRAELERVWPEAWDLAHDQALGEFAAEALMELARGAHGLKDYDRAEAAGRDALNLAETRREGRIVLAAEGFLQAVGLERSAVGNTSAAMPTADSPDEMADMLVEDFLASLQYEHATL
jgi:tetratricopeptide (TPR) repeat protein